MGRVNKKIYSQYLTWEGAKDISRQFTEEKKNTDGKKIIRKDVQHFG